MILLLLLLQSCTDNNWEFIKLGKILPFHGHVAVELTQVCILGDTPKKKDTKIYILVWEALELYSRPWVICEADAILFLL